MNNQEQWLSTGYDELLAKVHALEEALAKAERERDELSRMFEELTPGGTEFNRAPLRCFEYIREQQRSQHDLIVTHVKRTKEAEANAAKQKALADRLAEQLRFMFNMMENVYAGPLTELWKDSLGQAQTREALAAWEAENG